MPECDGCGDHVTEQYCRVFFAENEPVACLKCSTLEERAEHRAEVPDAH